jgi:BASS family bile acid:Na+ symporter
MRLVAELQHAIHKRFIWIVLSSYLAAAIFPGFGLSIRNIDIGVVALAGTKINLTLPPMMLALLLFNAGLGTRVKELRSLAHHPRLLAVGVAGNVLAPLTFIAAISLLMTLWHNSEEVQQILTGLALIAAMPIAGASTAWAQNSNGNLALSLGLILLTTLLSPIVTPMALHSVGFVTTGDYSEDLHELANEGAVSFLSAWVIMPSLLGLAAHGILGEKRAALVSPYLKLTNSVILILLNYSNAALSLPGVISQPDADFVMAISIIVGLLCVSMFWAGYRISRSFQADRSTTTSLMFGLGMNNNGAGLVLASLMLSDHPSVLLTIILYNLIQHLVASLVDKALSRSRYFSATDGDGIGHS